MKKYKKIFKFGGIVFTCFLGFFLLCNLIGYLYAAITPKFDIKSANVFYLYDKEGL